MDGKPELFIGQIWVPAAWNEVRLEKVIESPGMRSILCGQRKFNRMNTCLVCDLQQLQIFTWNIVHGSVRVWDAQSAASPPSGITGERASQDPVWLLMRLYPHWSRAACVRHTYVHFYILNYTGIFLFSPMGQTPPPTHPRLGRLPWLCQELPSTTTAAFNGWRFRALQILAVLAFQGLRKSGGAKFERGVVLAVTFTSICSKLPEIIQYSWQGGGNLCSGVKWDWGGREGARERRFSSPHRRQRTYWEVGRILAPPDSFTLFTLTH